MRRLVVRLASYTATTKGCVGSSWGWAAGGTASRTTPIRGDWYPPLYQSPQSMLRFTNLIFDLLRLKQRRCGLANQQEFRNGKYTLRRGP